jgi:hygromycin-B 7''-O-kinase
VSRYEYSKRLGTITPRQFQAALDRFGLGQYVRAEPVPFGLFGQNVFVTSTAGEFVLRGAAHFDWQFPKEQFIAQVLHERTDVPAPWPYLLDTDESIFCWKHGYVIMPRLQGIQLASAETVRALTAQDRREIAYVVGESLRHIQKATWRFAGQYDLASKTIKPFDGGFEDWLLGELRRFVDMSLSYNNGATQDDKMWIEDVIRAAESAMEHSYVTSLVMHDYKEGNLVVERHVGHWRVSGVFDLMEALFGDGELDLVRQLAAYMEEEDLTLAQAFLDGYQKDASVRPGAKQRLALYMAYDRVLVWEYFHRPENASTWWYEEKTITDWVGPYVAKLATLL